eukprot:CAMPEP_0119014128 /NCGR_PEP_ID=MMETSP1176-20130426/9371_1 /TAXON_ID=265551 /ORGANISM="Synedropsis recta cf, Strain CCMP1620" /LENGTH=81 /DNA_ID=CAMNT_0006967269 /DNA_START=146 /DNA_END=391 /DNA_ORIENTATION=-
MTYGAFMVAYRNGIGRAATNTMARNSAGSTRNASSTASTKATTKQATLTPVKSATVKPSQKVPFWERKIEDDPDFLWMMLS